VPRAAHRSAASRIGSICCIIVFICTSLCAHAHNIRHGVMQKEKKKKNGDAGNDGEQSWSGEACVGVTWAWKSAAPHHPLRCALRASCAHSAPLPPAAAPSLPSPAFLR